MKVNIVFPPPFKHNHPPIENVNELINTRAKLSVRAADRFSTIVGSWKFIIIQSAILLLWVIFNVFAWVSHWDPYPFILMNLVLSLQAAFATPIIMMSQNRTADRDRIEAHNDYLINVKSEEEARAILEHLEAQDRALAEIHAILMAKSDVD